MKCCISRPHFKLIDIDMKLLESRGGTSGWDLPEALDSGVLHDGAGRDGEGGIDGGVSRRDGRGPLVLLLLLLGVVGAHPLSSQALDAGFDLRERRMECHCQGTWRQWGTVRDS